MAWVCCENEPIANTKELRTDTTRPKSIKTLFDKRIKRSGNSDGYSRLSQTFWRACDIRSNTASNFDDRQATGLIYPGVASQSVNHPDITGNVSQPNAIRMELTQPSSRDQPDLAQPDSGDQPGSSQPCSYSPDLYHLPKIEGNYYTVEHQSYQEPWRDNLRLRRYYETSLQLKYFTDVLSRKLDGDIKCQPIRSMVTTCHTTRSSHPPGSPQPGPSHELLQTAHESPESAVEAGERNKTLKNVSNSKKYPTAHDSLNSPAETGCRNKTPKNVPNSAGFQTADDSPKGPAKTVARRKTLRNSQYNRNSQTEKPSGKGTVEIGRKNKTPKNVPNSASFQTAKDSPKDLAETLARRKTLRNSGYSRSSQTEKPSSKGTVETGRRSKTPGNVQNSAQFQVALDSPKGFSETIARQETPRNIRSTRSCRTETPSGKSTVETGRKNKTLGTVPNSTRLQAALDSPKGLVERGARPKRNVANAKMSQAKTSSVEGTAKPGTKKTLKDGSKF